MKIFPLLLVTGCLAQVGERQAAIVGGTADPGDPAVVLTEYDTYRSSPGGLQTVQQLCSGTLISPTVVLTAGHCTAGAVAASAPAFARTGPDIDHPGDRVYGLAYTHPAYDPTTLRNDVGVLVLERPFCGLPQPLPFNRAALDDSVVGLPLRLVGFGVTNLEDQTPPTKRTAVVTLRSFDAQSLVDVDLYRGPCRGDSGGPALLTLGGVETIAGVSSSGDAQCNGEGIAQRVDIAADFLQPFLSASPSPLPSDCHPQSGCSTAPGSPSSPLPWVLLLLLLSARSHPTRKRTGSDEHEDQRDHRCSA